MSTIIFLGPPGCGKGTQAKKLSVELKIPHIAPGDILRQAVRNKTEIGAQAEKFMSEGKLVPDELTVGIIKERLSNPDCKNGFILDGFPRNIAQAKALEGIFSLLKLKLDRVVYFSIPMPEVVKRLSLRRSCKKCGAVYHLEFAPPKKAGVCDLCGGELYLRHDDEEEVIKNRFAVYEEQTKPLIKYFDEKSKLAKVDATGTVEEIFRQLKNILGSL